MLEDETNEQYLSPAERNPYSHSLPLLTNGLLKIYEPSLSQIKKALNELSEKESSLLQQVHAENLALSETQHAEELHRIFQKIEQYHTKLTSIKKDMKNLYDRSVKLNKRALKVQQFRAKQEYMRQQKETEIKMEQDLIAKPRTATE